MQKITNSTFTIKTAYTIPTATKLHTFTITCYNHFMISFYDIIISVMVVETGKEYKQCKRRQEVTHKNIRISFIPIL